MILLEYSIIFDGEFTHINLSVQKNNLVALKQNDLCI